MLKRILSVVLCVTLIVSMACAAVQAVTINSAQTGTDTNSKSTSSGTLASASDFTWDNRFGLFSAY